MAQVQLMGHRKCQGDFGDGSLRAEACLSAPSSASGYIEARVKEGLEQPSRSRRKERRLIGDALAARQI